MAITLNGTTGITTPALDSEGNLEYSGTLTGGTGVINIGSGQVYKDASGNLGVGTSSPATKLSVSKNSAVTVDPFFDSAVSTVTLENSSATNGNSSAIANRDSGGRYNAYMRFINVDQNYASAITFGTATSGAGSFGERVRIDSAGNVGIGTSSPSAWNIPTLQINTKTSFSQISGDLHLSNNAYYDGGWKYQTTAAANNYYQSSGVHAWRYAASGTAGSAISWLEAMRIDASGNLLVGTTSFGGGATRGFQINATNTASNAYAQLIKDNNGTEIFQMRCNGGLANFSANNVNLSDERVKTDIKLASSYLDKICAIPVKTFKYKNQTDDLLNLGVIAQDVEAVAPELVDVNGFGETPDDGIPLKAIYETDLKYALMKCIQEQQTLIQALTARIEALEQA